MTPLEEVNENVTVAWLADEFVTASPDRIEPGPVLELMPAPSSTYMRYAKAVLDAGTPASETTTPLGNRESEKFLNEKIASPAGVLSFGVAGMARTEPT